MRSTIRTTAVFIAAVSALALAGCSSSSPTGGASTTTETTSAAAPTTASGGNPAAAGGLISVITPAYSNIFFKAEADAAVAEAQKLGYKTQADSHDDDPNKQSQLIDTAISSHAVAIILDNAGADVTIGAVQKATAAGIPVFLIDREINQEGIAKAQIVSNNAQGAGLVAQAFVKAMNGKGNYIELLGLQTDTNASVRSKGYHSVIDQYPNMKMVGQDVANWDQQTAFNKIETELQKSKDVQGIIAGNDTMAMGAIAAVDAAGLTGKVVVTGFDGSPDAANAIKQGKMAADAMQPAVKIAQMAVDEANQFLKTGSTGQPEKQTVDCQLIDSSNVAKYTLFSLGN